MSFVRRLAPAVRLIALLLLVSPTPPLHAGFFGFFSSSKTSKTNNIPDVILLTSNVQGKTDPVILTVSPSGVIDDKGESGQITVTFDRPMVALEAISFEEKTGPLTLDPPVKGKTRWFGISTLLFYSRSAVDTRDAVYGHRGERDCRCLRRNGARRLALGGSHSPRPWVAPCALQTNGNSDARPRTRRRHRLRLPLRGGRRRLRACF